MEPDKYSVYIAPSADRRLASHIEFLARVSENAAALLYEDYEEALGFLEDNPEACQLYVPENPIDAQLRYKLFGKRYRIVFEIVGDNVYAYDIQDCRQDTDRNLI